MSGDLFQCAPLAAAQRPPRPDDDTLVGPYRRQLLGDCRLKFWFALVHGDGRALHRRYELLFIRGEGAARYRVRGDSDDTRFRDYAIPEDLSPFPALTFPRHKGDRLLPAMQAMLSGDDLADAIRLSRFGAMPAR